ncbi:chemoreceptor glutamine deamidase CheD [Marinobacter sp. NSM]|uniref:chemoreceptor glutamine deamidase CheD n=1 Tax=Marinobacter sp. NSM TaxID=3458004 RepID=UPI0040369454
MNASLHLARKHYFDHQFDGPVTKVLPGEYYATSRREMIVTVLGSCVSACIRDPENGIGGMNHFLLPDCHRVNDSASARYGAFAMELLINKLLSMGASRQRLQAKVFGGGHVIPGIASIDVGHRNAEFVEQYLINESIPILASDLRDAFPRKVCFFPDTGEVLVKKIRFSNNTELNTREKKLCERVSREDPAGTIELFT